MTRSSHTVVPGACPIRLLHITTIPLTMRFLTGQLRSMCEHGLDVHVVSSPGDALSEIARAEGVRSHPIRMDRRPAPVSDLIALLRLCALFSQLKPDVVHAHTPKASLLGLCAAWITRRPVRIYQMHGLRYTTATGVGRSVLMAMERLTCLVATQVLCVSASVLERAIVDGLCPAKKIKVLGSGSINGIDATARFNPAKCVTDGVELKSAHHIPPNAVVIGFVGRLTRDKGVDELLRAWEGISEEFPFAHLLLVGPEEGWVPDGRARVVLQDTSRVHRMGFVDDPRAVYQAIDLLCLPSYREGFPVTLLEAAAMKLPVVASAVPGCVDAVEDGVTGVLCAPRDSDALRQALRTVIGNEPLRRGMGEAARTRVLEHFAQEPLWDCFLSEYRAATALSRGQRKTGTMYAKYFKRILDASVAILALVFLAPVVLITYLIVAVRLGRPVFFRQMRPGKDGRPFEILKFRTMTDNRDANGQLLADAQRLTRFGRFLRASSLDELPELWNVVKGEMSLVGPRPLLMRYVDRYTPEQARRHEERPGITGLAQVNGRNALSWERKFELDVEYVDRCSFALDAKILALTVSQVIGRNGISQPGHATAEEFIGTGKESC